MTQTAPPDPRVSMPLAAIDDLQNKVIMSVVATNRPDMRALRSLPSWRGVTLARLLFKASAITRAELDEIVREAEAFKGGVKLDKRPAAAVTDAAVETLCVALHPGWDTATEQWRTEQRQAVRDAMVTAVRRLDWSAVLVDDDQLATAVADPGSVVTRKPDETLPRWSARAVTHLIRGKLFG